jgi:hypothetical protein
MIDPRASLARMGLAIAKIFLELRVGWNLPRSW